MCIDSTIKLSQMPPTDSSGRYGLIDKRQCNSGSFIIIFIIIIFIIIFITPEEERCFLDNVFLTRTPYHDYTSGHFEYMNIQLKTSEINCIF